MTVDMSKQKGEQDEGAIMFKNEEHKQFFLSYLPKCRKFDVYHEALMYCLGITRDTRNHVNRIYDFKTGCIKTECLREGWQTSGSRRVILLAFNLYCNNTPSVYDYKGAEEQIVECREYTVENLFCCEFARYFWQAVKIRYPEYCYC